ncbi:MULTISPECIES: UDP-N-acetylmuramate dehydrogenase [unclassified Desulfovibrio]|uniref:UDP-N-acetylmuramate dehydrogenase n=1 Tax=unclassified Desulfovibrio TaxID=2593640 RepID=UPI0013EA1F2A|nr:MULTISPECIES: UDP-N-acetylmuramate dehydrogenase [unclassified Desulfovibrio]
MREIPAPRLAERTTLRLGGTAIAELVLETHEDAMAVPQHLARLGGEALFIGRGSNLLAGDGELPLVLVRPAFSDGPEIIGREGEKVLVRAGAGVPLPRLLRFCAENGLSGLEGLAGIPGSVGGAVAMNAGSFGVEACARVERLVLASGGRIMEAGASSLRASYRNLAILDADGEEMRDFLVLEAIFGLTPATKDGIAKRMRLNFFEKKSKQPVTAWSAGCAFKNPAPGIAAGKLLEEAGFRGRRLGGMAFSPMHANFLVHEGGGSAHAALTLLAEAREAVRRRFGHELVPEVRIVPCRLR